MMQSKREKVLIKYLQDTLSRLIFSEMPDITEELKNKIYALAYYKPRGLPDTRLEKMYEEIINDIEENIL